ncbi:MAG: TonB-dependent receptor [Pseudomonadota bacterium]
MSKTQYTLRFAEDLRLCVSAGALAAVALAAPGALAQEPDDDEETIVVTGTRLGIGPERSPTPLAVLPDTYIARTGETNLADVLRELPATGSSAFTATSTVFSTSANGVNGINLRNLGSNRTVVLVNGRRHVSGVAGSTVVDFNTFPTDLIERIEVITGGATAQYGADAVAGVVNLITRRSFDGVQLRTQYGVAPDAYDGQRYTVSATAGDEFDSGRGGFIMNFTYEKQDQIDCVDRDWCKVDTLGIGPSGPILAPVFSSFGPLGRFDIDGGGLDSLTSGDDLVVDPDSGAVRPFNVSTDGFNRSAARVIQTPLERFVVNANVDYELSDRLSFFFEGKFANVKGFSQIEPVPADTLITGLPAIPVDNPFCPDEICGPAIANGQTELGWARRMTEFGFRGQDFDRNTLRLAGGFNGSITDGLDFEISYVFGRTDDAQVSTASIDSLRLNAALQAEPDPDNPGAFRCVDAFARQNGCVPINLFGLNAASPEAVTWTRAEIFRDAFIEQEVLTAFLTADTEAYFTLPGGPVSWSAGFEYREERSNTNWDSTTNLGANSSNALPDVVGEFNVKEFFFETSIPVFADVAWAEDLTLNGAVRLSDYSTVGTTTAWNAGIVWAPSQDLRFRGKRAVAIRAPNITELFSPQSQTFPTISDPCANVSATSTGEFDDACRAIPEIAQAIARDGSLNYTQEVLQSVTGFNGGNPNVSEETARSWTAGVVLTPQSAPDLSITVDYFSVQIDNAIQAPSNSLVIRDNLLTGAFSDLVFRGTNGAQLGRIARVDAINTNIGGLGTKGIDVGFQYDPSPDALEALFGRDLGDWYVSVNYTYLDELFTDAGAGPDFDQGEIFAPKHQINANMGVDVGPLSFQYNLRWTGSTVIDNEPTDTDPNFAGGVLCDPNCEVNVLPVPLVAGPIRFTGFNVDDYFQHDIQARFAVNEEFELFAGINNLTNAEPILFAENFTANQTTGLETDGTTQINQIIGRYVYLGFQLRPSLIGRALFD